MWNAEGLSREQRAYVEKLTGMSTSQMTRLIRAFLDHEEGQTNGFSLAGRAGVREPRLSEVGPWNMAPASRGCYGLTAFGPRFTK
jgi:hypothetical protein